jgi:hypothetical protein
VSEPVKRQQFKMFNLFKRRTPPAVKTPAKSQAKAVPRNSTSTPAVAIPEDHNGPAALPEVVEGNEHTDWALWEDSMTALDSQMQSITPSAQIYEKDKRIPSQFQELDTDVFSKVNKNRDS